MADVQLIFLSTVSRPLWEVVRTGNASSSTAAPSAHLANGNAGAKDATSQAVVTLQRAISTAILHLLGLPPPTAASSEEGVPPSLKSAALADQRGGGGELARIRYELLLQRVRAVADALLRGEEEEEEGEGNASVNRGVSSACPDTAASAGASLKRAKTEGVEGTNSDPQWAASVAAANVKRLFVLICTTIQTAVMTASYLPLIEGERSGSTGATKAAPLSELPRGVALASRVIPAAIFALQATCEYPRTNGDATVKASRAAHRRDLQHQLTLLWYEALFTFLQQLSARNGDLPAWAQFMAACKTEASVRIAKSSSAFSDSDDDDDGDDGDDEEKGENGGERGEAQEGAPVELIAPSTSLASVSSGPLGGRSRSVEAQVELDALLAWGNIPAELLNQTVAVTRFRRAALLFKSFTPHMLTQAPASVFHLWATLSAFIEAWQAVWKDQPYGVVPETALNALLAGTVPMSRESGDANSVEAQLHTLIDVYADRLAHALASSAAHGYLLATVLGAVLCAQFILPQRRRASGSAPSGAAGSPNGSAGGGGGGGGGLSRRAATSVSTAAAPAAAAAGGPSSSNKADADSIAALEATSWLPPRPSVATAPTTGSAYCRETEWRLRQFPPLGTLLRRLEIDVFLRVHLFYFSTQLRIGLSPTHHVEGRQKFAVAAYLSNLCDQQTALLMYHFAIEPPPSSDGRSEPGPTAPTTALCEFTAAMKRFVDRADTELVMNVSAGSASASSSSPSMMQQYYHSQQQQQQQQPSSTQYGASRRRHDGPPSGAQPATMASYVPRNGALHGDRFCRMVFPEPAPLWTQYLVQLTAAARATPQAPTTAASAQATATPPAVLGSALGSRTTSAGLLGPLSHSPGPQPASSSSTTSAPPLASPQLTSPCRFVLELLIPGYYSLATDAVVALAEEGVNVFLVPQRSLASVVNVQLYVLQAVARRLAEWERLEDEGAVMPRATEQMVVLSELFALLRVTQTYTATNSLLVPLLHRLEALCTQALEEAPSSFPVVANTTNEEATEHTGATATVRGAFALTEAFLLHYVMPCLRVLPPSPLVYDRMGGIFHLWSQHGAAFEFGCASPGQILHVSEWLRVLVPQSSSAQVVKRGERATEDEDDGGRQQRLSVPPLYPHDRLRCKEWESVFTQTLKRMNAGNVDQYRAMLRPVLFSEPLFVADKLLTQVIGYENNFLALHTRLLKGLPEAILLLTVQVGLALMARYAVEEKLGSTENRVGLLGAFVATLWRDHPHYRLVGGALVRAVEQALRCNTRDGVVFGTELLRALLYHLLDRKLEHEEQYSAAQRAALVAPSVTRYFGKGSAESFRMNRWSDWLTPADVAKGKAALVQELHELCNVPVSLSDDDVDEGSRETEEEEERKGEDESRTHASSTASLRASCASLPLGQMLLLHLCRLHSRIYELQADLEGTMELVLLTSAKDFNVLNDLIFSVEELLRDGPPEALLVQVAMPHLALRLSARFAQRARVTASEAVTTADDATCATNTEVRLRRADALFAAPPPILCGSDSETTEAVSAAFSSSWAWYRAASSAVPFNLARQLSFLSAAHFSYDEAAYATALAEVKNAVRKASATESNGVLVGGHSRIGPATHADAASVYWLQRQEKQVEVEREAHRSLYQNSESVRDALRTALTMTLFNNNNNGGTTATGDVVAFAASYLLPRALLSMEDTQFVLTFFAWLWRECGTHRLKVVDMAMALVTTVSTYFVGLTDGECKRVGCLLTGLLAQLDSAHPTPLPAEVKEAVMAASLAHTAAMTAAAAGSPTSGVLSAEGGGGHGSADGKDDDGAGGVHGSFTLSAKVFSAYVRPVSRTLWQVVSSSLGGVTATDSETTAAAADDDGTTATTASSPAYPLQLEAFLCRTLYQILSNHTDVPPHVHRNAFLVMERIDRQTFPATQCATELLLHAVSAHADQTKPNFASATAVLKSLRDNLKQKRLLLHPLATFLANQTTPDMRGDGGGSSGGSGGSAFPGSPTGGAAHRAVVEAAKQWYHQWRLRENYMEQLLAEERAAVRRAGGATAIDVSSTSSSSEDDDDDGGDSVERGNADGSDRGDRQGQRGMHATNGDRDGEEDREDHDSLGREEEEDDDDFDDTVREGSAHATADAERALSQCRGFSVSSAKGNEDGEDVNAMEQALLAGGGEVGEGDLLARSYKRPREEGEEERDSAEHETREADE